MSDELLALTKAGKVALFVGSGATIAGRGCDWTELAVGAAKAIGIETEGLDAQAIFDDLIDVRNQRPKVIDYVHERLKDVRAPAPLAALLSVPWLAVATTNYDHAIENFYQAHPSWASNTMLGREPQLTLGLPGVMPVFKISGTLNDGERGRSMVLSSTDRIRHERDYPMIYHHFDAIGKFEAILAVGYSFKDNLLADAVRRIRAMPAHGRVLVFALFREPQPDSPHRQELKRLGVEEIYGRIEDFAPTFVNQLENTEADTFLKVAVGNSTISLPGRRLIDAAAAFNIVTANSFDEVPSQRDFLLGNTAPLGAYRNQLHWTRRQISEANAALAEWLNQKPDRETALLLIFSGKPGSGRTVAAGAVANLALEMGNCAIIRSKDRNHRINIAAAQQLGAELDEAMPEANTALVLIADENCPRKEIISFLRYAQPCRGGVVVIWTTTEEIDAQKLTEAGIPVINYSLPDTIGGAELDSLANYVEHLPRDVQPGEWTRDEIIAWAAGAASFIDAMWTFVHPSRKSFSDIVQEEFSRLDGDAREIVETLLLPSIVGTPPSIHLLSRLVGLPYPELYPALDEARRLIVLHDDPGEGHQDVALYHRRAARCILGLVGVRNNMASRLATLALRANPRHGEEHQLLADIIVGPPYRESPLVELVSPGQVLEALEMLSTRSPSRLLLHHYALRRRDQGRYDDAIEILERARDLQEGTNPTERKEIIEASLAQVRWIKLKSEKPHVDAEDPEVHGIRFDLAELRERSWNPNAFHMEAKILRDLTAGQQPTRALQLRGEAIGLLRQCLEDCDPDDSEVQTLLTSLLQEGGHLDEETAEGLLTAYGSGHGYYGLYEQSRLLGRPDASLLAKALSATTPCPPAIRTFLEAELHAENPRYDTALAQSDRLFEEIETNRVTMSATWRDHLQRVAILFGVGKGMQVRDHQQQVKNLAPTNAPVWFPYHLRKDGSRTKFHGTITEVADSRRGFLQPEDIHGFTRTLFFNPSHARKKASFQPGQRVEFNIGIGIPGVAAWDVALA